MVIIAGFAGCSKKSAEAIVVAKEYIAAGEERETPTPGQSPGPAQTAAAPVSPTPGAGDGVEYKETVLKPLAEDEVVLDGYVMKKDVQGTSKDPRAYPGLEQWRISVELVEGRRSFTVRAKPAQYQRLKIGDRVKVRYSEGNYTGTVWNSEIVD
ncbi:MAG TPA: hypothetical protein VF626_01185 [Chthoniobacterales bacterium]